MRFWLSGLLVLMLCTLLSAQENSAQENSAQENSAQENSAQENTVPTDAAATYRALVEEFENQGGTSAFAPRFLEFARQHPSEATALDALAWVLKNRRTRPEAQAALSLIEEHHLQSAGLGAVCPRIARVPALECEPLLRSVMKHSPHLEVRAQACLSLANLLEEQRKVVDQVHQNPQLTDRIIQYYGGGEYARALVSTDLAATERRLVEVYESMLANFSGQTVERTDLKDLAEKSLFRIRHLTVGRVAPEIEGEDIIGTPFKLSDYRGKVVVLSFWGHW